MRRLVWLKLLLLVSLLKERYETAKKESFKEVEK